MEKTPEHIGDMSRDELRELIRETLWEFFSELSNGDPDVSLEFRPEVAESLRAFLRERPEGTPLEEVRRELGLDE